MLTKASPSRAKKKAATRGNRVERTLLFADRVKSTDVQSAFIERQGESQGNARFRAEILQAHNDTKKDVPGETWVSNRLVE